MVPNWSWNWNSLIRSFVFLIVPPVPKCQFFTSVKPENDPDGAGPIAGLAKLPPPTVSVLGVPTVVADNVKSPKAGRIGVIVACAVPYELAVARRAVIVVVVGDIEAR